MNQQNKIIAAFVILAMVMIILVLGDVASDHKHAKKVCDDKYNVFVRLLYFNSNAYSICYDRFHGNFDISRIDPKSGKLEENQTCSANTVPNTNSKQ